MQEERRKNKIYSPEFKIGVIMDMREHHMSYHETVRKYWNISNHDKESNCIKMLHNWERIFLEEGEAGFYVERRGRARKMDNPKKGRPPKLDKKAEEDLIAENQRLKMEIEYLKKLSALVLAEERKNGKKR
jgi:transposase